MKLIVKADDYGSTEKITDAIIESMKDGIVRDTSFLVNSPHFDHAVKRANEENIQGMGLHLALTYRSPILHPKLVPSLITDQGVFYSRPDDVLARLDLLELEKEWRAQIKKFQSSGLRLTHLDSHHHVHRLHDGVGQLAIKLASELQVPLRRPDEGQMDLMKKLDVNTTDVFFEGFGGNNDNTTVEFLIDFLEEYKNFDGSVEIMAHPGYSDSELVSLSSWNLCREQEVTTLKDPKVLEYIKDNKIVLIGFKDL